MTTQADADRIVTLDIVRGVAVMGILAMNIVGFALPDEAYTNPVVMGVASDADLASWVVSFILVDGKMRGLFSFLFGASMLLVIDKAEAAGESPLSVHFRRMAWLLLFGLLHFYFVWRGDILTLYAVIGMLAFFLCGLPVKSLIGIGASLIIVQFLMIAMVAAMYFGMSAMVARPDASPEALAQWQALQQGMALTPAQLAEQLAIYRGDYGGLVHDRLTRIGFLPFAGLLTSGAETLAYMLFGMAALRSGFLSGGWSDAAYRRAALIGFGIGIPLYALLAWLVIRDGFSVPMLILAVSTLTVPLRVPMIVATAALIILLTRGGGALTARIAAAGRAAFTNYLGTSLLMTTLFYGYGFALFGTLSRIELWLPVAAAWALMLLWSKPWLDRYLYGPFEWLWRSLARGRIEPMRKASQAPA